ncbi:ATP-binding protein [Candidatus Pacearchaeota archaeon]|nr:ATP-binding protein [Candidatus Pacearchaeota archaeon]
MGNNFLERHSAKIQASLSILVKLALIASIAYFLYFHSWRILFVNLLLLVLVFLPYLSRKINIEIPREIEFILLIFVIISFFLGDLRGLVVQVFFGLSLGFVGFALITILYKNSKLKPNYPLIMFFSLSISLALGALSELAKFYLRWYLSIPLDISDYQFAMESLTLVFIGALLAISAGFFYVTGNKIIFLNKLVERFKHRNPNLFIEKTDSPDEIVKLIKRGESEKIEFKSTLRTNIHTGQHDKNMEHTILKTISAFLNSEGGTLLIGVSDKGEIHGIEKDQFPSNDKFNLQFTNLIKEYIGNENLPYLHFELILVEGSYIMKVDCMKCKKPVFLRFNKIEEFYVRVGASTVQLQGSKLVDYINNNFGK